MELLGGGPVKKTPCTRAEVERPFKATGETLSNSRSPCTLLTCSCTVNTAHLRGFQAQRHFCKTLHTWDNSITVVNKHWKRIFFTALLLLGTQHWNVYRLRSCLVQKGCYLRNYKQAVCPPFYMCLDVNKYHLSWGEPGKQKFVVLVVVSICTLCTRFKWIANNNSKLSFPHLPSIQANLVMILTYLR